MQQQQMQPPQQGEGVPQPVGEIVNNAQGKLFVGQVPAVCTEDMLRPVFQPYGDIVEIKIMRDSPGGRSKGCAWVKYATREQAQAAIDALHEQHTIPPQTNTLQVRFADDKARTSGSSTAFVGNLPANTAADKLRDYIQSILPSAVVVKDVNVPTGKLFGFVTFDSPQDCSTAVAHIQGANPTLEGNALRVQAARPRMPGGQQAQMAAAAAYYASAMGRGGFPMMDPAMAQYFMRGGFATPYANPYGFNPMYGGGGGGGYQQQQQQQGGGSFGGQQQGGGRGRGRGYPSYPQTGQQMPPQQAWNQGGARQQ